MRVRGFTYAEILVALTIVLLMTTAVVSNLLAEKASRDLWAFKNGLMVIAQEARSRSIETGDVFAIQYHSDSSRLVLQEETIDGAIREVDTLEVPTGIVASKFSADSRESDASTWRVPYYSDGATSGGAVEFEAEDNPFSFVLSPAISRPQIVDGPLPELTTGTWPAGGYAKRQ